MGNLDINVRKTLKWILGKGDGDWIEIMFQKINMLMQPEELVLLTRP
jgi:hypothetical protein